MTDNWKQMNGTEGSGEYVVLARIPAGDRIGVRKLYDGSVRIRIEPSDKNVDYLRKGLTREEDWKQPGDGGQNRFSVVTSGEHGKMAVEHALRLMAEYGPLERNRARAAHTWRSLFAASA